MLATVGDHIDEDLRLEEDRRPVGVVSAGVRRPARAGERLGSRSPRAVPADLFVQGFSGSFDARATTPELEHLATLLPAEWMSVAATGTPEQCVEAVLHQFDLGLDSVILHGATPSELAPILPAYRAARPRAPRRTPGKSGLGPPVNGVVDGAADLTAAWLSEALGTDVRSVD